MFGSSESKVFILIGIFVASALMAPASLAEETRNYDWLTQGEKSGSLVVTIKDDGSRVSHFQFNDRGRGPNQEETLVLDDQGMLQSLSITGNAYMGATVDERFNRQGDTARWQSTLESGEQSGQRDNPAWYLASEGTLEQQAALVRALLTDEDQRLPLLPAGEASFQRMAQETVSHGEEEKTLCLYAIVGLGLAPEFLWLDEDNQLFGADFGWMALVPEGWADILPQLKASQEQAERSYHQQLASQLTQALPESYAVNHVDVVDVAAGELLTDQKVVVNKGVIQSVSPASDIQTADSDATVLTQEILTIDGAGHVMIPGLWDMHAHVFPSDGLLNIAAGVTTLRDLANDHDPLMQTSADFASGTVIGPRVFLAGFIDEKSPYTAPTGLHAETLEEALEHIRWYAARGYPQIKIYSSITPSWVAPMAQEIHRNGMKLSGHIPSFMTAEAAVRQGFDEIQHLNMLFLNFLAGPEDDTRTPVRFSLVAEKGGELDLDSQAVTDFIELLKESNVVVDPTVTIFDTMFRNEAGLIDPNYAMIADHMPTEVVRGFMAAELDITNENRDRYAASADALLAMIKKLHDAGVVLVAGTDAIVGFTLHRELELYAQAGISNADVLRIATLGSAQVVGDDNSGQIAPGQRADLVLLKGNPLEDISAVRNTALVIRGNRMYRPAALHQAVGIKPFAESVQ